MKTETAMNGTVRRADGAMPEVGAPKLDWAVWCARRGLHVHPLHSPTKTAASVGELRCSCGDEKCGKRTGKHPRLEGWQQKATSDERQIRAWWLEWPNANIGIWAGAGDFFVLDEDGDDGRTSWEALTREHDTMPRTFTVGTGRGVHRYFAKPAGMAKITNSVSIALGFDVRADGGNGGNAVGPGSTHWSGRTYGVLDDHKISAPPDWLIAFVQRAAATECAPVTNHAPDSARHEDARIAHITMAERKVRAKAYVAKIDSAVSGEGGHNVAMRTATAVVRGFALDASSAREVLDPWNERCEPPWSEAELAHKIAEAGRVGAMPWGAKLLAAKAEGFVFRDAREVAQPRPPTPYVLPHFHIGPGRPTLLGGAGGIGKTILAQELALAVASSANTCWGTIDVHGEGRVVHLDFEMGDDALDHRYGRLARGMKRVNLAKLGDQLRVCSMPYLYLSSDASTVEAALIEACDGAILAIIDSLLAACPHAKSENDSAMRLYIDRLTRVSLATGCTFLVLAHEGKGTGENAGRTGRNRLRGSGAIADAANTVLSVTARKGGLCITQTKASLGAAGLPVHLRLVDAGEVVPLTGESRALRVERAESGSSSGEEVSADHPVERAKLAILKALRAPAPPMGVRELLEAVHGRGEVKQRALAELRRDKVVVHEDGVRGAKLLRLASGG